MRSRRILKTLRSVILGLMLCPLSGASSAETVWWVANGVDTCWNTPGNWITSNHPHDDIIPHGLLTTYITTSDHDGLAELPPVMIDASVAGDAKATAGHLYVGGFDTISPVHGDARNHAGVLNITGGELQLGLAYFRVGSSGARGTVNQSDGLVYTDWIISLGWLSPDSVGTWNISGGEVSARFDIGVHGTGHLNMTGRFVHPSCHGCRMIVGHGAVDDGVALPARGTLTQSGGLFTTPDLFVGTQAGAVRDL